MAKNKKKMPMSPKEREQMMNEEQPSGKKGKKPVPPKKGSKK
jgi:hypothetical protein